MRSRLVVALALTCGGALAACSLFVDTSDLESGSGPTQGSDASDSAATDSATKDAGPIDSSTLPDAPFVFSCDATLCEDFDESTSFQPVWNSGAGVGGAVAVVAKGQSLPNAFEPTVVVQSGDTYADISAVFSSSLATPQFRLELDVLLPANNPTANEADILDVEAHGSVPSYSIYLGDFNNQWKIAEYASLPDGGAIDHSSNLVVMPQRNAWSHLVFTSDGTTARVSIDGVVAGQLSLDPAAAETGIGRSLDIGWTYVENNTDPLDGFFDDVSMTFLP